MGQPYDCSNSNEVSLKYTEYDCPQTIAKLQNLVLSVYHYVYQHYQCYNIFVTTDSQSPLSLIYIYDICSTDNCKSILGRGLSVDLRYEKVTEKYSLALIVWFCFSTK